MWQDIIPILTKKNRVITIDLLGHGKSENLSYVHTMEEQAKMIKALLSNLRLRRFHIIGHSLGGYIALALAELFPKNLKSIVLINSTAKSDNLKKQTSREQAITIVKKNPDAFIKTVIPNLFSEESKIKYKSKIESVKKEALKTSQQGIIASLEGMKIRKDRSFIMQKESLKKMLIIGKKDPILNYSDLIEQAKNTNTKVVEFNNGHMSHIENLKELKNVFINHILQ